MVCRSQEIHFLAQPGLSERAYCVKKNPGVVEAHFERLGHLRCCILLEAARQTATPSR